MIGERGKSVGARTLKPAEPRRPSIRWRAAHAIGADLFLGHGAFRRRHGAEPCRAPRKERLDEAEFRPKRAVERDPKYAVA
jgi:hypothetical protein